MVLEREQILGAILPALEKDPAVNAAWLGGSEAFGAADASSDVDLNLDVADGSAVRVLDLVEAAAASLAPVVARWIVPEPAWHGHRQRFFRLRDAPETLLVDVLAMERSSASPRLDERERHGEPIVLFDRIGVAKATSLDMATHAARMRARRDQIAAREALFACFALKEARRGRKLDAQWAYQAFLLAPLVEILRMRHCPERFDFGMRYLDRDLPADVVDRLAILAYPLDLDDLEAKAEEARAWLRAELATAPGALVTSSP